MLERHYELTREMKLYEKISLDELSTEDISYYLKLRREYEELQNHAAGLIPSVLEKTKDLLNQARDTLAELVPGDPAGRVSYPFLKELVEVVGELEAGAEKIAAGCARLVELMSPEDVRREVPPVFCPAPEAAQEAACAADAGVAAVRSAPAKEAGQERGGRPEAPERTDNLGKQEKREGPGPDGKEAKSAVSPDTIKKIEMLVRPKEGTAAPWLPPAEEKAEKVIKIAVPADPKNRSPQKNNKDSRKK